MKLTAIILFTACVSASAKGFSQKVTLSVTNAPLENVLSQIRQQTGYVFFYSYDEMKEAKAVTVKLKDADIMEALKACLNGEPFSFSIEDKTIFLIKKSNSDISDAEQIPPPTDITGRITNEQGEPLSGASVIIKRTGRGDIADANGNFKLVNVNPDDIIIISFTGYKAKSIKVGANTNFAIAMAVADDNLDAAVVQAYGTTTQRYATGNIATVTAKEIEKQPVMNPLQALQGRVAGLVITPFTGNVSGLSQVVIRGQNTLGNFPLDPLYVIDGVPLTVLGVSGQDKTIYGSVGFDQTHMSPALGQSPLFSLNPADIQSIEVLKDADATAIYGSRGANGVILITTKKGEAGKTKFDANIYEGVSAVTRHWDMLNTQQYLQMRREAFKNDGITPTPANAPDLLVWDTTRYTDWQKYLWGNMGHTTDAEISLSGGDARTNFRIGAGYHRETDITTYSGANQRASVSFNLTHRSLNQKLSTSFTTNYSYAEANMITNLGAATLPPDAPAVFDDKGNLNYAQWDALGLGNSAPSFPFGGLLQPYTAKTNFLASNLMVSYQVMKGLSLRTSFGYNNGQNNQSSFQPIASQDPASNPKGSASFGNTKNNNWIIEPQAEYNSFIGKGKLNVLLGGSAQTTTTDGLYISGGGYTNDQLIRTISNATTLFSVDNSGEYKYAAVFGRINYNWENKYIINLNARRDGSSRFGPGKQFGNFASVGAAWIFTEEGWFKKHFAFLSFGKLRGSYGTTGSDAVGDYAYLSRWSANSLATYDGFSPLVPTQHDNADYHWATNRKLEAALDLGFLKDRININVAWYRNRCSDQLVSFPTPVYTGFSSVPAANWPADVQNTGWEFLLNAKLINSKKFSWSVTFNTAFNRNKLLAYPNQDQSPYAYSLIVGQPVSIVHLLHYTGVDPQTGQYSFEDKNHDGKISLAANSTDDRYIYDPMPKFSGGLGNNLRYKNWSLSAFFYFKKQKGYNALRGIGTPGTINNQSVYVFDHRWQQPGDVTNVARFSTITASSDQNFLGNSDGFLTDASFIRLANLSISYSLPERMAKKAGMQGLRIFIQAQNVFVITNYKGLDPETQNFGGMPPAKIFTGGLSFNF